MRRIPMNKTRILGVFAFLAGVLFIPAAYGQFSALYNFGSKTGDPENPENSGIIAQGRDGNLYSTAPYGGANGWGAVFKITSLGTLTTTYSFDGTSGGRPFGGLTLGTDGNLYGTTFSGGTSNVGTVFKITPSGTPAVLYNFMAGKDGASPYAPPIQAADGNFYGTASGGGLGYGTIYKISPSGTFTPLYQFDNAHGSAPYAPLVQGTNGNFYGTTLFGGTNDRGVVFKITASGKLTVLYNFDGTHGDEPIGPLVQGTDGNLYGTTYAGGTLNGGVVFKITPTGSLTVLHDMSAATDGVEPFAGLVQATDGNFYGVNAGGGTNNRGTVFEITPKASYSVLHSFDDTTGAAPYVTLLQRTDGLLYGDASCGGTGTSVNNCGIFGGSGVFFSVNASLPAFVTLIPYSAKVGKTIEFLGEGFTSSTNVFFNGKLANRTVLSGTYLTATVPDGATTGFVTLTTSGGTLKSNKIFRVIPQITSFSPPSGPVGTTVVITGESLKGATSVTFGGIKAMSFTVNSDMQVTATVPTGAKTGKIVISTPGGTATSSSSFTVT